MVLMCGCLRAQAVTRTHCSPRIGNAVVAPQMVPISASGSSSTCSNKTTPLYMALNISAPMSTNMSSVVSLELHSPNVPCNLVELTSQSSGNCTDPLGHYHVLVGRNCVPLADHQIGMELQQVEGSCLRPGSCKVLVDTRTQWDAQHVRLAVHIPVNVIEYSTSDHMNGDIYFVSFVPAQPEPSNGVCEGTVSTGFLESERPGWECGSDGLYTAQNAICSYVPPPAPQPPPPTPAPAPTVRSAVAVAVLVPMLGGGTIAAIGSITCILKQRKKRKRAKARFAAMSPRMQQPPTLPPPLESPYGGAEGLVAKGVEARPPAPADGRGGHRFRA